MLIEREVENEEKHQRTPKKLERGPLIVCLDTSGSMAGGREALAKSITLEAMRVAHAERRRCFLYVFSGPNQVAERELDLSPAGVAGLLSLLEMAFDGGTDVAAPLTRAVERMNRDGWNRADILIVTDGEFGVANETVSEIAAARKRHAVRLHGLLVSGTSAASLERLCDYLHRIDGF